MKRADESGSQNPSTHAFILPAPLSDVIRRIAGHHELRRGRTIKLVSVCAAVGHRRAVRAPVFSSLACSRLLLSSFFFLFSFLAFNFRFVISVLLKMSEEKHHHRGVFHHHKEEDKPEQVDFKQEEKHHKHLEHFGELGAVAAGAYALHEKHEAKKDPEHAHKHKIEEEIAAAAAVGSGGFAFHEHHGKKEAKEEYEEAHGKKHHHLF